MCFTAAALHVGIWGQHNTWNEYIYIYIYVCIYIIYLYIIIYILFIHTLSAQHIIWNIYIHKFRKCINSFQTKLNKNIKLLSNLNKTVTVVGKITNLCCFTKEEHDKHLQIAVTSKYKNVAEKIKHKINKEGKSILNGKDVMERLLVEK